MSTMTAYFKEVRGVAARTSLSSIFSENFAEKSLRKIWGIQPRDSREGSANATCAQSLLCRPTDGNTQGTRKYIFLLENFFGAAFLLAGDDFSSSLSQALIQFRKIHLVAKNTFLLKTLTTTDGIAASERRHPIWQHKDRTNFK